MDTGCIGPILADSRDTGGLLLLWNVVRENHPTTPAQSAGGAICIGNVEFDLPVRLVLFKQRCCAYEVCPQSIRVFRVWWIKACKLVW